MVRSLLNSSLLQRSSGLRFALLFIGICVVFAGALMWLGMADFDYHYSFDQQHANISPRQESIPYQQLSPETRRIVDAALNGRTFTFEDATKELPEIVFRDGTYYQFNEYKVIDWTHPKTLGPIVIGLVGLWLIIEAIQHERKRPEPRGV